MSRWGALIGSCLLAACTHAGGESVRGATQVPTMTEADHRPVHLAINGFNYTDLPISYFSVNGQGGSNIYVSSPTSGGGGTTCCITWYPRTQLPVEITVEWMRNLDGKRRWCERTVSITRPVPAHPSALGVHFMPDGDIRAEVTEGEADPILQLQRFDAGKRKESGNVIHDEDVARCRDGR